MIKKSKSTSSFTGTSFRGDLAEAFRNSKKLLQAAGQGTANLGEVSVTIRVKPVKLKRVDDTGGKGVKNLPLRINRR